MQYRRPGRTRKMDKEDNIAVLFVCMGNICRSPTAEGVFRKHVEDANLADRIFVDSAGTHAYHAGEPADYRARHAAERRGFSLSGIRARRIADRDFDRFDYILAMDEANLDVLKGWAPPGSRNKLGLFLHYSGRHREIEIPDPYYGGAAGFERVLDLVEEASLGLLETLRREL